MCFRNILSYVDDRKRRRKKYRQVTGIVKGKTDFLDRLSNSKDKCYLDEGVLLCSSVLEISTYRDSKLIQL
jgi:hypothetical protein